MKYLANDDRKELVHPLREKLHITNIEKIDGKIYFNIKEDRSLQGLHPKGHMLVDSDENAFVYILENDHEYIYVYFQEHLWTEISSQLNESNKFFVSKDISIELERFYDELTYLLDNIKDNHNYGETFVEKVERIFFVSE